MDKDMSEGWGVCEVCKKRYVARKIKYPFTDVGHAIPCPSCEATVGWMPKGTDDFVLISEKEYDKQQKEEEARPECPRCGNKMVIRKGYKEFWGCQRYPDCNGTRKIDDDY